MTTESIWEQCPYFRDGCYYSTSVFSSVPVCEQKICDRAYVHSLCTPKKLTCCCLVSFSVYSWPLLHLLLSIS